ncbi:MAG: UDP-N-acetylglucosamine--N-acetylmuramyl-(pentapeptide) pyrophosphoryl-undecaprenol N-acetylglucosamine transferase [Planctomycetes bacterium]|nr:UDP-N-acetylglucosamine--N-acetylmuramyl-(pentapeptide) pyrophosphoryl-undecaprenol N-acetylglucosamine transferase [Planctomycetota bacterium]
MEICERIHQDKPISLVLGLGGFASGPALKFAASKKIPGACLNPDSLPGMANRYAARFCSRIFVQWSVASKKFGSRKKKCLVTGCPVRQSIINRENSAQARSVLELDDNKKTLVIMGGSLGGRGLNDAVVQTLVSSGRDELLGGDLEGWQILHLTGQQDYSRVCDQYSGVDLPLTILPYSKRMDMVLGCADLVVARAGASSLAEFTTCGLARILVPYPHHRDRHQQTNAEILARAGAALIVREKEDPQETSRELVSALRKCLREPLRRKKMGIAAAGLAVPDAARRVAQELLEMTDV